MTSYIFLLKSWHVKPWETDFDVRNSSLYPPEQSKSWFNAPKQRKLNMIKPYAF